MLLSTKTLQSPQLKGNKFEVKKRAAKLDFLLPTELEFVPKLLAPESTIEFVTHGAWSAHHLLEKVLLTTGPANVIITTWAITERPLRTIHRLKSQGLIQKLGGLFDRKLSHHNPKAYGFAQEVFDAVILSTCHAKVTLIENKEWAIAINSSANYTVNRRTEVGTIHCSRESMEFHKKWIFENEEERQNKTTVRNGSGGIPGRKRGTGKPTTATTAGD